LGLLKYRLTFESAQAELEAAQIRTAQVNESFRGFLFTEGKTDSQHLIKSSSKLGINLPIQISQADRQGGGPILLRMCEDYAKMPQSAKVIFAFDSDDQEIMKKLDPKTVPGKTFQRWGNNVYSFAIPTPSHRTGGSQ